MARRITISGKELSLNLTAAGTAQAVSGSELWVRQATFQAGKSNSGEIFLGRSSSVSGDTNGFNLSAGDFISISAPLTGTGEQDQFNLADIYWDGGTTNDDLVVWYDE